MSHPTEPAGPGAPIDPRDPRSPEERWEGGRPSEREPRTEVPSLVDLLALEEIERSRLYRGDVFTHLQKAFGGQVMAESMLAAYRSVGEDRDCHSLHAYFLRPGETHTPVLYDVEDTREGRSFSSRRVIARQDGVNIFQSAFSFHVEEPGLEHRDPLPGEIPGPDDCPSLAEVLARRTGINEARFQQEWNVLEVRYVGDSKPGGGIPSQSHGAHMRLWVRTARPLPDEQYWHRAALAYVSDLSLLSSTVVPHDIAFGSRKMMTASIDHSMWFHRPARADQWLLYDQVSPSASGALGFAMGRMFQDGVLVASCAQEGLIRVMEPGHH